MMKSLEKRISKIEQKHNPKPVSIFADWCIARNPEWWGDDQKAFTEWLSFYENSTKKEREDPKLNPDVGFEGSLHSNRL